jgi:hypothetical protein
MHTYMNSNSYVIVLNVDQDVADSTVRRIVYKKPSGATGYWPAMLRGLLEIYYLIQENDLDEAGKWELQAYVETPGWSLYGEKAYLDVEANIEAS